MRLYNLSAPVCARTCVCVCVFVGCACVCMNNLILNTCQTKFYAFILKAATRDTTEPIAIKGVVTVKTICAMQMGTVRVAVKVVGTVNVVI